MELSLVTPDMRRAQLLVRWQNKRLVTQLTATYYTDLPAGNASQVSDTCSTRARTATLFWA